jgi:hypothetical protein
LSVVINPNVTFDGIGAMSKGMPDFRRSIAAVGDQIKGTGRHFLITEKKNAAPAFDGLCAGGLND